MTTTENAHPYFVRAEAAYQNIVKPAFLKAKAKFEQTGNEDDLLPFGMPNRPLPNDNDPKDKGNGFNNTRQSPTVFITTTEAATDLPDGKAGVIAGEVFLRYAAELISRRTHRLSAASEVKEWREAGDARKKAEADAQRKKADHKAGRDAELAALKEKAELLERIAAAEKTISEKKAGK